MVGETGSGKTTQYAHISPLCSRFVTGVVQDTAICRLLRHAPDEEENRRVYTATPSGCHVRSETCFG